MKKLGACFVVLTLVSCASKPAPTAPSVPINARIGFIDIQPKDGSQKEDHNNYLEIRNYVIQEVKTRLARRGQGRIIGVTAYLDNVSTAFNPIETWFVGDVPTIRGHFLFWDATTKAQIAEMPFKVGKNYGGLITAGYNRSTENKEEELAKVLVSRLEAILYPESNKKGVCSSERSRFIWTNSVCE